MVTTRSGSKFELGEMNKDYRQFLEENNYEIDEENPVKMVDKLTHIYKKVEDDS